MALDSEHAHAVMTACALYEPPREGFARVARSEGLAGLSLEDAGIDLDVPIPLILKVEAWARVALRDGQGQGRSLLCELWGEAYDRRYGAQLRLLGEPGLLVFETPPRDQDAAVASARWALGVGRLSERTGVQLPPEGLVRALGALWPAPLDEIWEILVTRDETTIRRP